jgi:hypothetical protein
MFTNPRRPNISDYLAFVYGVGIPPANFPSATGTATGGDLDTLTDSTAAWSTDQWKGYVVQDILQQQCPVSILSSTADTLTFAAPMSAPVAAGDKYLIGSQWLFTSFSVSLDTVNTVLEIGSSQLYLLAVYNLGVDRLLNYAQDVPDQTYFRDKRKDYGLFVVKVGVPSAAADNGTSTGILNPEFMKTMTLGDLQTLKTEFGRRYMEIAQNFGPNVWGIS